MPSGGISNKHKPGAGAIRLLKVDPGISIPSQSPAARQHPWKVVHACEFAREVLPLVQGQTAAGMRPSLITPGGYTLAPAFLENNGAEGALPVSLLQTWNHVREWRKLFNESAVETFSEIVHAHSFAAGMAAVRASSSVVYQFKAGIEALAVAAGHCAESSWLARSFRVAEHFVLTRAAAVVVNRNKERLACLERGVSAGSLFLIPEPVDPEWFESTADRRWLEQIGNGGHETVFFLIPSLPTSAWDRRDALRRWMRVLSILRQEYRDVRFLFLAEWQAAGAIHQMASACHLMPWIGVLSAEMHAKAMASADVILCDREHVLELFALEALARGRALLAADVDAHREISPEGRGCIWFRSGEVADIARRASFLACNPQFRRALGVAGRDHSLAARGAEAIGARYDAVYRRAFSRRKDHETSTPKPRLIPLQAGS
jgi:glycosyltransferase involved in cell wall biosynthesis